MTKGAPRFDLGLDACIVRIAPDGPLAVIAGVGPRGLLLCTDLVELLRSGETGVGPAFKQQLDGVGAVDVGPRALVVRPVRARFRAFVELNLEIGVGADQVLLRALHSAFAVGILNAQIKHAAALMRQPFAYPGRQQASKVHEPGRAGREPGDFRPFR